MSGAIPPHPTTPSWRGAQLKARGQLYLYLYNLLEAFVLRVEVSDPYVQSWIILFYETLFGFLLMYSFLIFLNIPHRDQFSFNISVSKLKLLPYWLLIIL